MSLNSPNTNLPSESYSAGELQLGNAQKTSEESTGLPIGSSLFDRIRESILEVQALMYSHISNKENPLHMTALAEYASGREQIEKQIAEICELYKEIILKNDSNTQQYQVDTVERNMLSLIKMIESYDDKFEKALSATTSNSLKSMLTKHFIQIRADVDNLGSPSQQVAVRIAEARLVSALGNGAQKAPGGATGSITYQGFDGKRILLFKPKLENVTTKRKIEHAAKGFFNINRQVAYCRDQGKIPAMYSEISASVADNYFGTNLVPATRFAKIDGQQGSVMVWSDNHREAADHVISMKKTVKTEEITDEERTTELVKFQKMVLFDYLIGNLDRHDKNWLVQQDKKGLITSVKAIDNANAFLTSNPTEGRKDFVVRQKQYAWKSFPLAMQGFKMDDPEIQKFFIKLNQPNCVGDLVSELRNELLKNNSPDEVDQFLTHDMLLRLQERVEVLKKLQKCSNLDYPVAPHFLATLSTQNAIDKFLA